MSTPKHTQLTREQIEQASGRELDALVAEQLFGWTWRIYASWERDKPGRKYLIDPESLTARADKDSSCDRSATASEVGGLPWLSDDSVVFVGIGFAPEYSTSGDAMLLVLERMRGLRFTFVIHTRPDGTMRARFGDSQLVAMFTNPRWIGESVTESSLPAAVCRAALLAILAREEAA